MSTEHANTLYFDGQCPLCSREIKKLKERVKEPICFVDVHHAGLQEKQKRLFLKKLHLFKDGEVKVGFEANLALWLATRYEWFFSVFKLPIIFHFCSMVYNVWAKYRFARRYPDLD